MTNGAHFRAHSLCLLRPRSNIERTPFVLDEIASPPAPVSDSSSICRLQVLHRPLHLLAACPSVLLVGAPPHPSCVLFAPFIGPLRPPRWSSSTPLVRPLRPTCWRPSEIPYRPPSVSEVRHPPPTRFLTGHHRSLAPPSSSLLISIELSSCCVESCLSSLLRSLELPSPAHQVVPELAGGLPPRARAMPKSARGAASMHAQGARSLPSSMLPGCPILHACRESLLAAIFHADESRWQRIPETR
jgi:hypothetical protein